MNDSTSVPGVYIENLGCAKNQVDAEIMGARMEEAGWRWVTDVEEASLILVNTCGFIQPAQEESIDTAFSILAEYPHVPLVLTGCLAQQYAQELAGDMPELAGVFGNREPDRIAEFVRRVAARERSPLVWVPPGDRDLAEPRRRRLLSHPGSAYLKIAEGCDHHCSFCAIPAIRGAQRARGSRQILTEFRGLRDAGIREFNLVAQDLAAWHGVRSEAAGATTIAMLLESLLAEEGDFWLRPLYLYPDTFPMDVVELSARDPRLLPYFDLSFQHGSGEILRRMGRPGDAERYLRLIDSIRGIQPEVALRSSFIVGFPGETESHLQELLAFIRAAELEWVGVFEFSPQAGTHAGDLMQDTVSAAEKQRRRAEVEALQGPITTGRLERFTGRVLPVLIEEAIQGTELFLGRSPLQAPEVDGLVVVHGTGGRHTLTPGTIVNARVTAVTGVDVQASCLSA